MTKLRIMVITASLFLGPAFNVTADAPPPTCCTASFQGSAQPSLWLIVKILWGIY